MTALESTSASAPRRGVGPRLPRSRARASVALKPNPPPPPPRPRDGAVRRRAPPVHAAAGPVSGRAGTRAPGPDDPPADATLPARGANPTGRSPPSERGPGPDPRLPRPEEALPPEPARPPAGGSARLCRSVARLCQEERSARPRLRPPGSDRIVASRPAGGRAVTAADGAPTTLRGRRGGESRTRDGAAADAGRADSAPPGRAGGAESRPGEPGWLCRPGGRSWACQPNGRTPRRCSSPTDQPAHAARTARASSAVESRSRPDPAPERSAATVRKRPAPGSSPARGRSRSRRRSESSSAASAVSASTSAIAGKLGCEAGAAAGGDSASRASASATGRAAAALAFNLRRG